MHHNAGPRSRDSAEDTSIIGGCFDCSTFPRGNDFSAHEANALTVPRTGPVQIETTLPSLFLSMSL